MQTKSHSAFEAFANLAVGIAMSILILRYGHYVAPAYLPKINANENFTMTVLFTLVSILRSYWIRRWFNRKSLVNAMNKGYYDEHD